MKHATDANETLPPPPLSPPAADAFARVCKYGDEMLCHGILMAIAALAMGFGLEMGWSALSILGAVLLWVFGCNFSDARKLSNKAKEFQDAPSFSLVRTADGFCMVPHGSRHEKPLVMSHYVQSQAP